MGLSGAAPMRHLIISREFPPTSYAPGGIGTYVATISRLLAEAGETVHVIAQQWAGAPEPIERRNDGHLIIHRVAMDTPLRLAVDAPWMQDGDVAGLDPVLASALATSIFPQSAFAWRVALLAEWLVEHEGIDVIEAQEYEAPLAYFQVRRALGLGPPRQPPCLVHLHSPTELILRHNEYSAHATHFLTAVRLEDYSICAADGWLCPSRYLANQAMDMYGIPEREVHVIPLPRGDTPFIDRDLETWRRGPLCFVGRLEPRKGVLEWLEAAVRMSDVDPTLEFTFIGGDLLLLPDLSMKTAIEARIPARLRPRISIFASQPRDQLLQHLGRARAAVVPSRWENFPNTCLEAMATGLPVLVSPNGGMTDMVVDGESGWVASSADPEGLAAALLRVMNTPPDALRQMGRAAADRAGTLCDNNTIVERHLAVRSEAATRGATRSGGLPPNLPWSRGAVRPGYMPQRNRVTAHSPASPTGIPADGTAIVVLAAPDDEVAACLAGIDAQTIPPRRRLVVVGVAEAAATFQSDTFVNRHWEVVASVEEAIARLRQTEKAAAPAFDDDPGILAIAVCSASHRLHPTFLERGEDVLRRHSEVGVVTPWVDAGAGQFNPGVAAVFPFQLLEDLSGPVLLFRAEALTSVGGLRSAVQSRFVCWDAATAVMAAGWAAISWPERLATNVKRPPDRVTKHVGRLAAQRAVLERVPDVVSAAAIDLVMLLRTMQRSDVIDPAVALYSVDGYTRLRWAIFVLEQAVRTGLTQPRRAARWLLPRIGRTARRAIRRILRTDGAASAR